MDQKPENSTRPKVLITGASRGIGAATAKACARAGYDVAINYATNENAAKALQHELHALGAATLLLKGDVGEEADVESMFAALDKTWGRLDALVNNAGILETHQRLDQMTLGRWERVFRVNVLGSFMCAKAAVKRMSTAHAGKGGAIVNVSSIASRLGSPFEYVDYASSKAAVDTMTIGLAKEVAAQGIRVNAVRPGLIYTDIHASGGEPGRVDRLSSAIPMKRGGAAEEIADTVVWLLSAQSSYVTGSLIDVSGGR
jgi:NAD(P)-dependent dehydrogenase (short-subunit alcohol dehydrogenase family)